MKRLLIVALSLFCCTTIAPQTGKSNPCDPGMAFCWYSDDVEVWGSHWVPQDPSEKSIEESAGLRCVKALNICALARSVIAGQKNFVGIEMLQVIRWDAQQITADGENNGVVPCEKDSYIFTKLDQTVLLIASAGPQSDTPACSRFIGKPKTVIYKLSR
jgi:hypothetical protein